MQSDKISSTPDNELPPIEGELTDEDLKQVAGGTSGSTNGSGLPPPPDPGHHGHPLHPVHPVHPTH